MIKQNKLKKFLSILLIATLIFPLLPISQLKVQAQSTIEIQRMNINYTYKEYDKDNLDKISFFLTAKIATLGNHEIKVRDSNGSEHNLGRILVDENNVNRTIYPSFELKPRNNIRINQIYIGGLPIIISGPTLNPTPKITNIQSYSVLLGESLKFEGQNLNAANSTMSVDDLDILQPNNSASYSSIIHQGSPGYKNIEFIVNGSHSEGGQLTQIITYPKSFKLMGTLNELGSEYGDHLQIIPEMGENESIAYIRINSENGAFNLRDGKGVYSVFFLKDTTDEYSVSNMAEVISYSQNRKVMKIKIPKDIDDSNSYEVQVTNKIANPRGNINEQIEQRRSVQNSYFVMGANKSPVITSISPDFGPDTGEIIKIGGRRFDEIDFIDGLDSIDGVKADQAGVSGDKKLLDDAMSDIIGTEGIEIAGREDDVIHIPYTLQGSPQYKNETITSIDRYIAVYVGDRTKPHLKNEKPVFEFTNVFDNISIEVPASNVDQDKKVNIIMIMQTEIQAGGETHTFVNIVTDEDKKYTIKPSFTRPTISSIIPEKIQVVKNAGQYRLKEDMVITINGSNFQVIRTLDSQTGRDITNYPIVGLGADLLNSEEGIVLRISPVNEGQVEIKDGDTWKHLPGANMMILNQAGKIIDGTLGLVNGGKIVITLPKSWNEITLPSQSITTDPRNPSPRQLVVRNPILGSQEPGEAALNQDVSLMFVDIGATPSPTIDEVIPNVVALDSGEEIIVTGSNFQQGARVFLGGLEISGLSQELDPSGLNTILKFNAPKFPQIIDGPTKIMVMNEDGGIAVKDFTYVKSLQRDPILSDFSPKKGTKQTRVIIDGNNFLVPNPSTSSLIGIGIYRLIGTRLLMDGKDISEYNIDSNGSIELKPYTNPSQVLISTAGGLASLADYSHSIVLEDTNRANSFYTIYRDNRGTIILSDGGSGAEEENIINQYRISLDGSSLIGEKGGQEYAINAHGEGLQITGNGVTLNLKMTTPYKFDPTSKDIYGSRVHVKDKNRIEIQVPSLTSKLPGGYTITTENPDTKKSTGKDLFYYYETVTASPSIDEIKPSIGSIDGGYQILIEGQNFEDDSKVYIDGVLVPKNTVNRQNIDGIDTLVITSMPPYRRDMNLEETDRKLVPITVENGNGGTALARFTYVIPPSAKPEIDSAEFQKENQTGSAGGDEILTITGRYFKFEESSATLSKYQGWKYDADQDIYYEDIDGNNKFTQYTSWRDYKDKSGPTKPLLSPIETYEEHLTSPVLPTVRIGGIKADIVEFGPGYIRVITPQLKPGRHDLYLVNNDFGTSKKTTLNFQGSTIKINSLVPNVGAKQGGTPLEIIGSGFQNSRISLIENDLRKEYNRPLVRFGTIGNTKDINNNMGQVVLEGGDFTLDYNNTDPTNSVITMAAKYNDEIYSKIFNISNYNGQAIYLPIGELKNTATNNYPGFELVKIEIKDRKLIVEKGYSPQTLLNNPGKISLQSPSYSDIGQVEVRVINADGASATSSYSYTNPASKPRISNITRDSRDPDIGDDGNIRVLRLDYRGGQNITVLGGDFRTGASVLIGDILTIANKDIVETLSLDPNKLAFEMPKVDEKLVGNLYRLTVINGDGASTSSDNINNQWNAPIYIQFIKGETDPALSNIVPDRGPATGGTRVTITGKDFRETMEGYEGKSLGIFFGELEVAQGDINIISHDKLEVIAPPSSIAGPVRLRIENPDGTLTQDDLIFTYISKPKIDDVNPKKLFSNDTQTVVTLTGQQFMPGARVIIGGRIIPTKDLKADMVLNGSGITGVDGTGSNMESSIVGGVETATALVEGTTSIKITFTGAVDLDNISIIVINPDGGISDPYDNFKYELPLPLKPMVLEAIPGYEGTVMLIWNKSDPYILNQATNYEIFGRKSKDTTNTFIATTDKADHLLRGLEPDTEYTFMVRALNEFGGAIDFATVQVRTLSTIQDPKQKEKMDKLKEEEKDLDLKGKETMVGSQLIKTLGRENLASGIGILDLTLAKYKNINEYTIKIPLALARTDSTLIIKDSTINLSINPKDLYTYKVSTLDTGDKDANLIINIKKARETNIPRGKRTTSLAYKLDFAFQNSKTKIDLDKLLRSGKITLNLDNQTYGNRKNVYLYKFDIGTGVYTKASNDYTTSIDEKGRFVLLSDR